MHEHLYYYRVKEVVSVYDGDSLRIVIDMGFKMYAEHPVRLARIDTPEMRSPDPELQAKATLARDYLRGRLEGAMSAGADVVVRSVKLEKYGRALCELYIDDKNINEEILELGLGVGYAGGHRGS